MNCSSLSNTVWKRFLSEEKQRLIQSCVAVFIWGLIAHAYGFLNLSLSHDSLFEFYVTNSTAMHKVELGRFCVPIYQLVFHGQTSLPWLNGLLALCWLSVSVWLVAYIFSIKSKTQIALISGFFTANITVTALVATYMHDFDADMFAVMLAVIMVFLWQRGGKYVWLGIPLLVLVLGIYQSMLSVAISLIMLVSIAALLRGDPASAVIRKGILAIGIILSAGIVYLLVAKLSCLFVGIEFSSEYNSIMNLFSSKGSPSQLVKLMLDTYYRWLTIFSNSSCSFLAMLLLHIVLAVFVVIATVHMLRAKQLPISNKLLVVVLSALLPLGMNISCFVDGGMVHDLMLYSAWFTYLLVIILINWYTHSSKTSEKLPELCQTAAFLVLALILITNVQTSNNAYVKKDLERQTTLSMMTVVNAQMNETEGYIPGKTNVIFVGTPKTYTNEMFPNLFHIIGLSVESPISYTDVYTPYYRYVLQTPLLQSKDKAPEEMTAKMVSFPESGYIQWYNDVLVVKISD